MLRAVFISIILGLCNYISAQSQSEVMIYNKYEKLEKLYTDKNNDTTYVVNFWATWCGPCVKELPYFEQLTEAYKDHKVKVILVSLDFPKKMDRKLLPFLKKRQLKSDVVLLDDPKTNKWIDMVDPSWSGAIPVTLFVKNGHEFFWGDVYHDYESLEKHLLSLK